MSRVLERSGGAIDDWYKLWPLDKHIFLNPEKTSGTAYGVKFGVAVSAGDIVGPQDQHVNLLGEYAEYCRAKGRRMAFLNAANGWLPLYETCGFKSALIGHNAIVDLARFSTVTQNTPHFRLINNRAARKGWNFHLSLPPHNPEFLTKLEHLSIDWAALPKRREWRFINSPFSAQYANTSPVYYLLDRNKNLLAFLNCVRSYEKGTATFDLMRRSPAAPNGAMDYLISEYLLAMRELGYFRASLGLAPIELRELELSGVAGRLIKAAVAITRLTPLTSGLAQFKAKFEPELEPRYIVYQPDMLSMIKTSLAVYRLLAIPKQAHN